MKNFLPGTVIVALSTNITAFKSFVFDEIEHENVELILRPPKNSRGIESVALVTLKCKQPDSVNVAIECLKKQAHVVFAEPNYHIETCNTPNDPLYNQLWGLERIGASVAWDTDTGSNNVAVGVLDSGVDENHPDLRPNLLIPQSQSFSSFNDITGHGTHVAGTIGAVGNNRIGVVGVSWQVGLAIFKIGDFVFDIATAINAINFANNNNIPILNLSWGLKQYSQNLRFALEQYTGLVVVAAGNDGSNIDIIPDYPTSYGLENVISVSATNQQNQIANFSCYGAKSVHIAAPGVSVLSTDIRSTYSNMDGTSMAAPYVAGAAALLKSYNPNLTTRQIKQIILSSVKKIPYLKGKVSSGGILNIQSMMAMAKRWF